MTERVKEQDKIGGWDGEGGEDTEEAKKTRGNSQVKGKGMEDGLKKTCKGSCGKEGSLCTVIGWGVRHPLPNG